MRATSYFREGEFVLLFEAECVACTAIRPGVYGVRQEDGCDALILLLGNYACSHRQKLMSEEPNLEHPRKPNRAEVQRVW